MKILDIEGKHLGNMYYCDGRDVRVGDLIKLDKVYIVLRRVWEASVGEITSVFVREAKIEEISNDNQR